MLGAPTNPGNNLFRQTLQRAGFGITAAYLGLMLYLTSLTPLGARNAMTVGVAPHGGGAPLCFVYNTFYASSTRINQMFNPALGVPLPERNYATDCALLDSAWRVRWDVVHSIFDICAVGHVLGWLCKALVVRSPGRGDGC